MKILHYTLGLPLYRSGGLTKYSHDLMVEQVKQQDDIYLLFPGRIGIGNTKIKYYTNYKHIKVYEIVNPLPVPLLKGVSRPAEFMKKCDKTIFVNFLDSINVNIVHIHTFMGLYEEFLEACKELNIKIVYTTHDYYGLCTKVNFTDHKGEICNKRNLDKCIRCNYYGYRISTIKILQSPIYRFLKNKEIVNKIKNLISYIKKIKTSYKASDNSERLSIGSIDRIKYERLIHYYESMYSYIDKFLFNSTVAKDVYNEYLNVEGEIISITHNEIKDNRVKKYYGNKELKLTYLGPNKEYKGFNLLVDVMKSLKVEGYNDIVLNAYGDNDYPYDLPDNIRINGRYSYNQLKNIFDKTDLLIVPSIWHETFGFITLEALSYGVPVLVTNNVGSKDIISRNGINKGIIVSASKDEIKDKIIQVFYNKNILTDLNDSILNDSFYGLMEEHYRQINSVYLDILHH